MEQQTILASDFSNRQDLESYIKAEIRTDIPANKEAGHTIQGTREKLKQLQLDDKKNVFGIKCVITDTSTKSLLEAKAEKIK